MLLLRDGRLRLDSRIMLVAERTLIGSPLTGIRILKENKIYRITDLILRKGLRWQDDRETILNDSRYAESVLFKYLTEKRHENDFQTLKAITCEYIDANNVNQPRHDEVVVHVRLGDIMDDYGKRTYGKCLAVYSNFASRIPIKKLPVNRATIVTAMHFGADESNGKYFFTENAKNRSYRIAELLTAQLVARGLDVNVFSHDDIDLDFCYMVGSHYFVKGQSELSDLVVECLDPSAKHFALWESWIRGSVKKLVRRGVLARTFRRGRRRWATPGSIRAYVEQIRASRRGL